MNCLTNKKINTDMTKRKLLSCLFLMFTFTVMAQNADQLYREGKALYDAKRFHEALPKLKAAADKGHRKAQYRLGRCFDKGEGVAEDNVRAFQWYFKAASQGHPKAQYQVGRCYKKGKGVAEDQKKAYAYFVKAARQDNADAEMALAKHFYKAGDKGKAKSYAIRAVRNPKGGDEVLAELKKDAANGSETSKAILLLLGK